MRKAYVVQNRKGVCFQCIRDDPVIWRFVDQQMRYYQLIALTNYQVSINFLRHGHIIIH